MTMTLGELIADLKKYDRAFFVSIPGGPVTLRPDDVDSYRGYYEDLAIGAEADRSYVTVGELLDKLCAAEGSVFTGYKGGEFRMGLHTRVWISNYGESSGARVTGTELVYGRYVHLLWERET